MHQILLVAAGGAIGASLRFGMASWVSSWASSGSHTVVPVGTLTVNLFGSLLIGWLWGMFLSQSEVPIRLQLFLITGILGGFTTFSSFSLENLQLLENGQYRSFIFYLLVSNLGGIALAFAGFKLSGSSANL